ncbi:hypothetical protein MBANPS3_001382 [Mucor bainieri]
MTTSWNKLPTELWTIIFDQVGSAKVLSECRLVCKAWDPLVERAMFNQQLSLSTQSKIVKICNTLKQKPFACKYVLSMDLGHWDRLPVQLQRALFNRFRRFENLKRLQLTSTIQHDLTEVDSIIGKYQQLKSLSLSLEGVTMPQANEDDFLEWMPENIQQSPSVADITVNGTNHHAGLIEYLLFKYPNVSSAYFGYLESVSSGAIQRILKSVETIPDLELGHWWLEDVDHVRNVFSALSSTKNLVFLRRCPNKLMPVGSIAIGAHRIRKKDITTFRLFIPKKLTPQILSMLDRIFGSLGNLDIDYRDNTEPGLEVDNQDTCFSDKLFQMISVARTVKIFDAEVAVSQLPDEYPTSTSLYELEFCGSVVDERVLPVLDQVAPNLRHLTLNTCILNTKHPQSHYINMPSSDLASLSIVTQATFWDNSCTTFESLELGAVNDARRTALWVIHRTISIQENQIVALLVSTLSGQQHFALKPGRPATLRAISEQDYTKHATEWPSIVIKCKSLTYLRLDLGALLVLVKFGIGRPIESIEDWVQEAGSFFTNNHVFNANNKTIKVLEICPQVFPPLTSPY